MRLIACSSCHTQYDVTHCHDKHVTCRCGEPVENRELQAVEATVCRCGSCGAQVSADAAGCDYCGASIARPDASAALICPECYARSHESSRFCTACGVSFNPESIEIDGEELPCPACSALMPVASVGGIGVNDCPGCHGLWAPKDRFNELVNRAIDACRSNGGKLKAHAKPRVQGANPGEQRVQYRKCPVCEAFMHRSNFRKTSGVIIDSCRDHGTWLDADELERIAGYLMTGGRPQADQYLENMAKKDEAQSRAVRAAPAQYFSSTASSSGWGSDSVDDVGGTIDLVAGVLKLFNALLR